MRYLILLSLLAFSPAFACKGKQPTDCHCDPSTNKWTNNVTNQAYSNSLAQALANSKSNSKSNSSSTSNSNSNSTAYGGNATATGGTAVSSAQGGSGGSASADGSNNTSITTNVPRQVQTAYSASLTSGLDTCLGSASGGIQTEIVGFTAGSTKTDGNCVLIKQTQLLYSMGLKRAACYRMQAGKEGAAIKDAMNRAGIQCDDPVLLGSIAPPVNYVTQQELETVVKKGALK